MKTTSHVNRKVQLAFGSAIVILLVIGALSYRGMVASNESDRWVRHTYDVIGVLQDLHAAMQSVESSCRGYVLTGDESFLESCRTGIVDTEKGLASIRKLTVDNPEQQHRLTALERLAAQKIQFAEKVNSLRRNQGLEAAANAIRSGSGKQIMDDFREVIRDLRDEESRLLTLREAEAKYRIGQTKTAVIFGAVLALLITTAAGWSVRRDSARRGIAEAKYRGLLEAAPDAMVVVNPDGEIVLLNAQAENKFGYRRDELVGQQVTNIIPAGFTERLVADGLRSAADALAQQIGTGIELVGRRKDGSEFPIEIMLSPLESAEEILVTAAIRDISMHKLIEEEVRETKTFLASIFDNIPNSIFVKDARDLRFVRINTACETLTGYAEKEMLGKNDYDLFPKEQADFFVAQDRDTLAGNQQVSVAEETITSKDGTQKVLQTKKFSILDKDGHPRYLLGMSEDITVRKQAEQSLQERGQIAALGADVGAALTRGKSLEEMLQLCCEAIVRHLYAAFARIWTVNAQGDILELRASAGMYVHLDGAHGRVPVGKFKIGLIAQERKPHLTNHVVGDPRVGDQGWAKREGMVAFAGYPLLVDDHLVGVVAMFARNPLADVTLQGLASISNNIALGINRKLAEEALRESESRFRRVAEQSPDAIGIHQDGKIVFANDALVRLMRAASAADLVGRPAISVVHPAQRQAVEQRIQQLYAGRNLPLSEQTYVRLDGTVVAVETSLSPFQLDGKPAAIVTVRDITERKVAQDRIVHLNRVYATLSGINTLIVRVRNLDELFREACQVAIDQGGFRSAWIGIVDRSVSKIVPVASAGMDEDLLTAIKNLYLMNEDPLLGDTMAGRAMRDKKPVVTNDLPSNPQVPFGKKHAASGVLSLAILPLIVSDQAVGVLALYARDNDFFHEQEMKLLTELAGDIAFAIDHIGKQERLDYLAYYDVLTGLANRSLFLERVAQYMRSAVSSGHKLAVFILDLERFRNINDSLGRPAGDALLKQVAEFLSRDAGDPSLLARVGADQFAIVVPELKQKGNIAGLLEGKIRAFLDHTFRLNDTALRMAIKVGGALFPSDGTDANTLLQNAEAALKKAKASGERYLFYVPRMTATVAGKLTLENQLRQALDKEEFVLHYQPKVNLVSGKLTGAEALIRWNDPRTGLVPPGRFIPILEETGLIYDVGRWALRKAIEDYLRRRSAGLAPMRIAVNVSPLQLRNRGFIAEIKQAIGIDAQAAAGLELEITESLIMEDVKHSIASLQAIRAMGVSIAIDDFGTGFSSLSYLAKLPVDTLKIDRSFVTDMTTGPEGLALVSTIINLAHSLKLKVVAEGVETEEQSRMLRLLNCDEMQGYLFSKPLPGEIFETKYLPIINGTGATVNT